MCFLSLAGWDNPSTLTIDAPTEERPSVLSRSLVDVMGHPRSYPPPRALSGRPPFSQDDRNGDGIRGPRRDGSPVGGGREDAMRERGYGNGPRGGGMQGHRLCRVSFPLDPQPDIGMPIYPLPLFFRPGGIASTAPRTDPEKADAVPRFAGGEREEQEQEGRGRPGGGGAGGANPPSPASYPVAPPSAPQDNPHNARENQHHGLSSPLSGGRSGPGVGPGAGGGEHYQNYGRHGPPPPSIASRMGVRGSFGSRPGMGGGYGGGMANGSARGDHQHSSEFRGGGTGGGRGNPGGWDGGRGGDWDRDRGQPPPPPRERELDWEHRRKWERDRDRGAGPEWDRDRGAGARGTGGGRNSRDWSERDNRERPPPARSGGGVGAAGNGGSGPLGSPSMTGMASPAQPFSSAGRASRRPFEGQPEGGSAAGLAPAPTEEERRKHAETVAAQAKAIAERERQLAEKSDEVEKGVALRARMELERLRAEKERKEKEQHNAAQGAWGYEPDEYGRDDPYRRQEDVERELAAQQAAAAALSPAIAPMSALDRPGSAWVLGGKSAPPKVPPTPKAKAVRAVLGRGQEEAVEAGTGARVIQKRQAPPAAQDAWTRLISFPPEKETPPVTPYTPRRPGLEAAAAAKSPEPLRPLRPPSPCSGLPPVETVQTIAVASPKGRSGRGKGWAVIGPRRVEGRRPRGSTRKFSTTRPGR
ncbi:unnamed protein product [Scytosiphon promiscuus]